MLSGFKDTDREILLKLKDRDLLNACSTNKYFSSLCDESFFRNRIAYKYPLALSNKPENMKWKQFYLKLVFLIGKMKEVYDFDFVERDPERYYRFLNHEKITYQFYFASKYYLKDLLAYLINRENKKKPHRYYREYIIWGLSGASAGHHEELVDWYLNLNFLNKSYLNKALAGAANEGDNFLIKKLIEKGADNFNLALYNAGLKGRKDSIELLLKHGGNINEALSGAGYSKLPKEFIDFLLLRNANIDDAILIVGDDQETVNYLRNFL